MVPEREESSADVPSRHRTFATTHWSVVLATRDTEPDRAQQALERLCAVYWYPIYACIRRFGHEHHEAEDLTQGFWEGLLSIKALQRAEPGWSGRARSRSRGRPHRNGQLYPSGGPGRTRPTGNPSRCPIPALGSHCPRGTIALSGWQIGIAGSILTGLWNAPCRCDPQPRYLVVGSFSSSAWAL